MALPKRYETVARLGWTSTTGDPEGEIAPGPHAARAARAADRRAAPAPAGVLGGQGRRRARLRAGARAARRSSCPSARSTVTASSSCGARASRAAFAIECSSGTYVRSLIADLGDAYCLELRRTAIGAVRRRGRRPGAADRARRRARLPARRVALGERRGAPARVARRRRSPRPRRDGHVVRLRDDDGLIALAEPRADGDAQARRRLPRLMDVTWLPDAAPRPRRARGRRVRRRAPRPPRGDRGRRHGADVRAAPARGGRARVGAEAADHARASRPT